MIILTNFMVIIIMLFVFIIYLIFFILFIYDFYLYMVFYLTLINNLLHQLQNNQIIYHIIISLILMVPYILVYHLNHILIILFILYILLYQNLLNEYNQFIRRLDFRVWYRDGWYLYYGFIILLRLNMLI